MIYFKTMGLKRRGIEFTLGLPYLIMLMKLVMKLELLTQALSNLMTQLKSFMSLSAPA